ncbi:MAG: hypothetical protein HZA52_17465 [Planctomycetes bacterium]|nr:hypothetical protein [Planctomycetota bacterium]
MIRETRTPNRNPAITSDRWHVIHARWDGIVRTEPLFVRTIVSEHDQRAAAINAALELEKTIATDMADRDAATRDQIYIRRPAYTSLVTSPRLARRTK